MTATVDVVTDVLALAAQWRRPSPGPLADEYERLFVGPGRVPCPPYESLWRDDVPRRLQGTLLGPCVADLESCYRGLGLQVATTANELPDHIAVELEGLAVALADAAFAPVARALLTDHLMKWAPAFCTAVVDHAEGEHYRRLAGDTLRLIVDLHQSAAAPDD